MPRAKFWLANLCGLAVHTHLDGLACTSNQCARGIPLDQIPNNPDDCQDRSGVWKEMAPFGIPPPDCLDLPEAHDNHKHNRASLDTGFGRCPTQSQMVMSVFSVCGTTSALETSTRRMTHDSTLSRIWTRFSTARMHPPPTSPAMGTFRNGAAGVSFGTGLLTIVVGVIHAFDTLQNTEFNPDCELLDNACDKDWVDVFPVAPDAFMFFWDH